jgi:hypothetical protein
MRANLHDNLILKIMEQVSTILKAIFVVITLITVWQFYEASNKSKAFLIVAFVLSTVQLFIGLTNFYENGNTVPPRFLLLIAPAIVLIIILFATNKGRRFIDNLNLKKLTLLHTIRIPVEIVLYFLFIAKAVPQIMTFEGRNFDILAGLTAPIIFYFGFMKNKISNRILLLWNLISLGLLINIVVIAILSTKTPFQQFAFDQPNIAITHFPFNWLPSIIVPIVLLSHLAAIKQLILQDKTANKYQQ